MISKIVLTLLMLGPILAIKPVGFIFPRVVEMRINKTLDQYFKYEEYHKAPLYISDSFAEKRNSQFFSVENKDSSKRIYLVITIANSCRIGGCDVEHKDGDQFEQFYIMSIFDSQAKLLNLKTIDYQSEYGYEITSGWWLKQFEKNWGKIFEYNKNIDAISGATVSVKSMIKEMNFLQTAIHKIVLAERKKG